MENEQGEVELISVSKIPFLYQVLLFHMEFETHLLKPPNAIGTIIPEPGQIEPGLNQLTLMPHMYLSMQNNAFNLWPDIKYNKLRLKKEESNIATAMVISGIKYYESEPFIVYGNETLQNNINHFRMALCQDENMQFR